MIENDDDKYLYYTKIAWAIYTATTVAIILVLVLFIARDNEERLFYTLAPAVGAYVFRPLKKPFSKIIFKFTGVSHPSEDK